MGGATDGDTLWHTAIGRESQEPSCIPSVAGADPDVTARLAKNITPTLTSKPCFPPALLVDYAHLVLSLGTMGSVSILLIQPLRPANQALGLEMEPLGLERQQPLQAEDSCGLQEHLSTPPCCAPHCSSPVWQLLFSPSKGWCVDLCRLQRGGNIRSVFRFDGIVVATLGDEGFLTSMFPIPQFKAA
eukprot:s144_g3.t1